MVLDISNNIRINDKYILSHVNVKYTTVY